jgi:hypothetical protein
MLNKNKNIGYIISYLARAGGAQVDSQGNVELEIV